MFNVKKLAIPGVTVLTPKLHRDNRGYVAETIHERKMADLGMPMRFVQENQTLTHRKHTIRGLHFQKPPHAQTKLIRVLHGSILDVAVDIRPDSPTFGKHAAAVLTADEPEQMLIPAGFAHGFCTLEDDTVVLYKMSAFYAPESEGGILWNDPDLHIEWSIGTAKAILIERDGKLPRLKDLPGIDW